MFLWKSLLCFPSEALRKPTSPTPPRQACCTIPMNPAIVLIYVSMSKCISTYDTRVCDVMHRCRCMYVYMHANTIFFETLCNKTHLYAGRDSLIRVSRLCACACMCTCIGVKFVYSCMYTSIGINLLIRIYPQNRAYLHYIISYITDVCLMHAYTDKETHTHTHTQTYTHTCSDHQFRSCSARVHSHSVCCSV